MLTALTVSSLLWCGCRSVPGLNRFARTSEPSADVLAGTGPSATYPAPPSVSATPQAIASVAGGTQAPSAGGVPAIGRPSIGPTTSPQTAQVAGIDVSPGYATPATNYAAANANGVYSKPTSNVSGASKPSPYTFGSKTFTPKTTPETSAALPVTNYGSNGKSPYAKSSFGLPATTAGIAKLPTASSAATASTNYTVPPSASAASQPISTSIANSMGSSSAGSQSGFTLPTSVPTSATASITAPVASTPTASGSPASGTPASFGMPGLDKAAAATAPAYSTANSMGSLATGSKDGYMPGSTGKSSAYPGKGQETPATSGSFYR